MKPFEICTTAFQDQINVFTCYATEAFECHMKACKHHIKAFKGHTHSLGGYIKTFQAYIQGAKGMHGFKKAMSKKLWRVKTNM